jgi:hypothetical protein
MKLATWMEKNGHTDNSLAPLVGRDRTTVMRWRTEQTRPDWEALAAIEKVTKRRVTASDFVQVAA